MLFKSGSVYRSLAGLLVGAVFWTLCLANDASAQQGNRRQGFPGTIEAGATIAVRTSETIKANDSDGRVFDGIVDQDVINRNGNIAIPRGSDVEMVVKRVSDNEVALDLEAVTINGKRFGIDTEESSISTERKEGIGGNKRTGKYVGGGALLGAVIGAIAGGGKGAAIGAGAGAAAGAGAQVLTRGRSVNVPAESLLTFRLEQPLRAATVDNSRSSAAYRAGFQAGRSDSDRNLRPDPRSNRWNTGQARRDYEAGYNRGYQAEADSSVARQKPDDRFNRGYGRARINIGRDNNVRWEAPGIARIFVQVDNEPRKLFAEGPSGTQEASWMMPGHRYVFIMQDLNGNEIARDQLDVR